MKRYIFILIAVSFALPLAAQHASPQPDAVYNLLRRSYTINDDGTMDINYRKEITLLRNRAITAYADKGETFILYNPAIERLTINESYTLRPDSSKVVTPANAFVEQLPSQCTACGRYNGLREMAVIHTGLEYGCTIVLDYTIHRNSILVGDDIDLQQDCPVKCYDVIYNHHGRIRKFCTPAKGTLVQDGNDFHWRCTDIPQRPNDPYLPHDDSYRMRVSFLPLPQYEARPSLAAAADVVADLHQDDPLRYAIAIRDWVHDYVNLNDIPAQHTDFEPAAAIETFASNCGTPLDRTALLCSMLREAGFQATIENGSQDYFDQRLVRVVVTIDGMQYRLSANNKQDPRVVDAAIDEVRSLRFDTAFAVKPVRLGGQYYQLVPPADPMGCGINPVMLSSDRKEPLFVRPCDIEVRYTLQLDKDYQLLNPLKVKQRKRGIGSVEQQVSLEGRQLVIYRHLVIDKAVISPAEYDAFCTLMIQWLPQTLKLKAK